jgi:hypothetical protein
VSDTEQRGAGSQMSDQDQDTLDHNPNVGGQGMVEGTDASGAGESNTTASSMDDSDATQAAGGGGSTSTGTGGAGMSDTEDADSSGGQPMAGSDNGNGD